MALERLEFEYLGPAEKGKRDWEYIHIGHVMSGDLEILAEPMPVSYTHLYDLGRTIEGLEDMENRASRRTDWTRRQEEFQKRLRQAQQFVSEPVSYTHLDVYKRQPFN